MSTIFLLNAFVTIFVLLLNPLLFKFLKIQLEQSVRNSLLLIIDSLFDAAIVFINIFYLEPKDFINIGGTIATVSICWPIFCTIMRVRSVHLLLTIRYPTKKVEVSFNKRRKKARKNNPRSVAETVSTLVTSKRNVNELNYLEKHKVSTTMFVICALLYALGQFVYFQIQVHKINQICSPKLGPELWKVATPKLIFHKGLFQPVTECKLENITTIISTNKNIEAIGKALINCTGLITFDLSNNKIKNIPVDLLHNEKFATQFRNLKTFKLNNNPIATELSAGNAGILAIPDIIIRFFTTLTYLDLSNNAITSLPNNLSALKNLNYLNVYNNSINSNGVKLTFAKFCLQNNIKLNLKQNYIYEYVNWSRQNLRNVGVESNINLLKVINFTQVYLNISGLDVSDNNLRNTDFTEVVFPSFSQIKHLNFARNDLYLACTGSIIHGIGNMSTMDSQRQFYLDLSKWPNLLYLDLRNNSRLNGFLANDLFAMERRIMEKNATMLISGKLLCLHISIGEATNSNSIFPKILLNQYYNSIQAFEMKLYEEKDVISFDSGIFNIMDNLQYLYMRFFVNTRTTLDPKMFYHKNLLYLKIEGFFNWNSSFNGGHIYSKLNT